MTLVRALDISAYQKRPPAEWWKRMKAEHGLELAIIGAYTGGTATGLGPNPWAMGCMDDALAAGLEIATYSLPSSQVESALDNVLGYHANLLFLGHDVEDGHGVTRGETDYTESKGVRPVIYSSAFYWPAEMGVSEAFCDLPLWHAAYMYSRNHSDPSRRVWPGVWPDAIPSVRYGGWSQPVAWQFAGDVEVLGINVDLDVIDREWLGMISEARIREIAKEEAAAEVDRYNSQHFEDDHQYLAPFRNAWRRIRRRGEKQVVQAVTHSMVSDFRATIAGVPRPAGVGADVDAVGAAIEDVTDAEVQG